MTGLFAPDGCVRGNIATQVYRLTFAPKCEHDKIRGATVDIRAESEQDARRYAGDWLRLGVLRRVVVTSIEPIST